MEAFTAWVKENGVDTAAVSIDKFDEGGFGLKAKRDIKVVWRLWRSYLLNMSSETLHNSCRKYKLLLDTVQKIFLT